MDLYRSAGAGPLAGGVGGMPTGDAGPRAGERGRGGADKAGGTYTLTLGEDHSVQDHVINDPQNPQTYVRSLDLFPNYIRYVTPSADDLIIEAVRVVVSGTSYDYAYTALAAPEPPGSTIRLGKLQGSVLHLSQQQGP